MLSYAGVPLVLETDDLLGLQLDHDLRDDLRLFATRHWPGVDAERMNLFANLPRSVNKIGVLTWPRGASNFAVGNYLVSSRQLELIRQQTVIDHRPHPALWKMDDGRNAVETYLYALPARPLFKCGELGEPTGPPGLYRLTLVDERFWWWFRPVGLGSPASWYEVIEQIELAVDDGFSIDFADNSSIETDWGAPGTAFRNKYVPTPAALDALAFNVGRRVVRTLDGRTLLLAAQESLDIYEQNRSRAKRLAGGEFELKDGSLYDALDTSLIIPEAVEVGFPLEEGGYRAGTTFLQDLIDLSSESRDQPGLPFAVTQGRAQSRKLIRDTLIYEAGSSFIHELGNRIARAWYRWRIARPATRYSGALDWDMEGHSDTVEFEHRDDVIATRAVRAPWLDHEEDMSHDVLEEHAGSGSGSGSGSGGSGSGSGGCGTVYVYDLRCESGVWKRYRSSLSISGECISQSAWSLVSHEGRCDCCSGSGSGSGGSGDTSVPDSGVVTPCCPGVVLPNRVWATVSCVGCGPGPYPLDRRAEYPGYIWTYRGLLNGDCNGNDVTDVITFSCGGGDIFFLSVSLGGPYAPTATVCNPLYALFEHVDLSACGCGSDCTVTVVK